MDSETPAGEMKPALALEKMIGSFERMADSLEFIAGFLEVVDNMLYNFPPDIQRVSMHNLTEQYRHSVDEIEAEDGDDKNGDENQT